jgi:anti-sigma-K factor RskA
LKHDRSTADIQECAALYALGSLTLQEARTFEAHLREGCPVCESELRRFERTVAGIGMATAESTPPDYLRDLLLARIERETRTNPPPPMPAEKETLEPTKAAETVAEPKKAPTPVAAPIFRTVTPAPERSYLPWAIAGVCALAAIMAFYSWKQAEKRGDQLDAELRQARQEASELQTLLDIHKDKNRELDQINAVLASPGSKSFAISGQPPASLVALWNTQKNLWVLTGYLSPPPAGKAYQVWFTTWGGLIKAGSLKTDASGRVFTTIDLPPSLPKITAAEITLEPQEGSAQPTLPAVAMGKITS